MDDDGWMENIIKWKNIHLKCKVTYMNAEIKDNIGPLVVIVANVFVIC